LAKKGGSFPVFHCIHSISSSKVMYFIFKFIKLTDKYIMQIGTTTTSTTTTTAFGLNKTNKQEMYFFNYYKTAFVFFFFSITGLFQKFHQD
jgi:hypothetical protein